MESNTYGFEHLHDSHDFSVLDEFAFAKSLEAMGDMISFLKTIQGESWIVTKKTKRKYRSIDDPWEI